MSSLKRIDMIIITTLIILLVFPIQSMVINDDSSKLSARHKRWTFNSWRLHGRRELLNDFYSPKTSLLSSSSSNNNDRYGMFNNKDHDTYKINEQLSQLFRNFNRT